MNCPYVEICGGCPMRLMPEAEYRQTKKLWFDKLITAIRQSDIHCGQPIFIADGSRRRTELTFTYHKKQLTLGFNAAQSHNLININNCLALTPVLNDLLLSTREFLANFCTIQTTHKIKSKIITTNINHGEIWLTEADNGVDVLLEIDDAPELEHRMLISDWIMRNPQLIRFSIGAKNTKPEIIIEKAKPFIQIANQQVFIAAGAFLQPSKAGEQALINLVLKYVDGTSGKIADLFCGIGTFSYPLAENKKNKITAIDSSPELLSGFQQTVNAQMIPNIEIQQKNLFKYPLDADELKPFDIVIIDPPRAGATAQVQQLAKMSQQEKPQKIVAVSCNPHTFINDANALLAGGYELQELTMVDQFVYTKHCELVALFTKKGENDESK